MDYARAAREEHASLRDYSDSRSRELSAVFPSELATILAYERLICRLVLVLGDVQATGTADLVFRDLTADAFDMLHNARNLLIQGWTSVTFPLLRRAFETISLFEYFLHAPTETLAWAEGKRIENRKVRDFIQSEWTTLGEDGVCLRERYSHFSSGTHPNREHIPMRRLGSGNKFVLGAIGAPDPLVVGFHMLDLLDLWFWFGAVTTLPYQEVLYCYDEQYCDEYLRIATKAQRIQRELTARLRAEQTVRLENAP